MESFSGGIVETERAVLAVVMNDSHAIFPVMEVLDDPDDFQEQLHRSIYTAIIDLTREDIVPNIHTVSERTRIPIEALQEISKRFNTKANKEVRYLAEVVAREATWRRINEALDSAKELAAEKPTDIEGFVFLSVEMITSTSESKDERDPAVPSVNERLDGEIQQFAALRDGELIGYTTGLKWLDIKAGGLSPSHMWVISAPYKGRKTSLLRNFIVDACSAGASFDVMALEGDQNSTAASLRAMVATDILAAQGLTEEMALSELMVKRGMHTREQRDALEKARKIVDGWNLRIYDGHDRISAVESIAYKVKRDKFLHGLNIIALDYIQLLGDGKLFERLEHSTHIMQRLAVEEGITVILLAQLNESTIWSMGKPEESYSPGVKGGGDVPAAADFLLRTTYNGNETPDRLGLQMKLARHAQPGEIEYKINKQSGRIMNPWITS